MLSDSVKAMIIDVLVLDTIIIMNSPTDQGK